MENAPACVNGFITSRSQKTTCSSCSEYGGAKLLIFINTCSSLYAEAAHLAQ